MTMKLPKWCAVFFMALALSGCFMRQGVPNFLPKSQEDIFVQRVAYLESQGINVVVVGDTVRFVLSADDFFEANTAEFCRQRENVLATIVKILNTRGCAPVIVTGHSDDIGCYPNKRDLSYNWAFSIASYLWNNGVDRSRMQVTGEADHIDTASYGTIAGSSYNRRVEIYMGTPE